MQKLLSPSGETVNASDHAAPVLIRDHGYTDLAGGTSKKKADAKPEVGGELTLAERIVAVSSHEQANVLGKELGLEFAPKKPNLGAKKQALTDTAAAAEAAAADDDQSDGLDDLSDEELAAKVAEAYPDYDPEAITEAVAKQRDEVIADLRQRAAAE